MPAGSAIPARIQIGIADSWWISEIAVCVSVFQFTFRVELGLCSQQVAAQVTTAFIRQNVAGAPERS